ncbi:MAG: arginine--tRNA ligase [Microscillaceae bacterium]
MNPESILIAQIEEALRALFDHTADHLALQPTAKDFEGSHTLVVFPFTKALRRKPEEIGQQIGEYLLQNGNLVADYNVVKGFLNLRLHDTVWKAWFSQTLEHSWGLFAPKNQKVMVEFASPNTNKPLHLGHLRNIFLGDSLARILAETGYEVIKANLVNDRGIHICKSMVAYQHFGQGEQPSPQLKGDHLVGKYYVLWDKTYKEQVSQLISQGKDEKEALAEAPILKEAQQTLLKWEANEPQTRALWQQMNQWVYEGFAETFQKIGIQFDKTYYESNTYLLGKDMIEDGLARGVFYRAEDGSVWIDLEDVQLDKKLLLRADGTSVYMTQDLGTADLKYEDFGLDKSIYVVGNEQDYHFQVLFEILKKLGRPYAEGLFHLSYGMVDLPSGKMKSREGTVVDADDLFRNMLEIARTKTEEVGKIEELNEEQKQQLHHTIATGALKYYLLRVEPKKRMLFNPEESVDFEGDAGPFIQYNYARIQSMLRKARQASFSWSAEAFASYPALQASEIELIASLIQFPAKLQEAAQKYAPSLLAQYAYETARAFSKFYNECRVLSAENETARSFRLALSEKTAQILARAFALLGIAMPEQM